MKRLLLLFVFLARVASAQSHADVVMQVYNETPPPKTVEGIAAFTVRVVQRLNVLYPNEQAALLQKLAGESIAPYAGTYISASRVCYPGQKLFKIWTDVPNGNPAWNDDGVAEIGGYMKGCMALAADPPPPPPPPPVEKPPAQTGDLAPLMTRVIGLETQIEALSQQLQAQTDAIREDIKSLRERLVGALKEAAKYVLPALGVVIEQWIRK